MHLPAVSKLTREGEEFSDLTPFQLNVCLCKSFRSWLPPVLFLCHLFLEKELERWIKVRTLPSIRPFDVASPQINKMRIVGAWVPCEDQIVIV